jgi:hypothetical protein
MEDSRRTFLHPLPSLRRDARLRNNLAHCFVCQKNFNNIELMLALE